MSSPKHDGKDGKDDKDGDHTEASCNPDASAETELEEILRGDAIGSTLYSERFVLQILIKLTTFEGTLAEDEQFEKDLCALWDMTIEDDVVCLLLEHDTIDVITNLVTPKAEPRLLEVLIGILGNMCSVQQTCDAICEREETARKLLQLISCGDTLTLVQLMRLLITLFVHLDVAASERLYLGVYSTSDFVRDFAHILNNSLNRDLLAFSLEALNAMVAKFAQLPSKDLVQTNSNEVGVIYQDNFSTLFGKEAIVGGVIEAFNHLIPQFGEDVNQDTEIVISNTVKKFETIFLNIHSILLQYVVNSRGYYVLYLEDLISCIRIILEPLCTSNCLLPITSFELETMESINDIFLALGDPFDDKCTDYVLNIWNILVDKMQTLNEQPQHQACSFGFDEDAESIQRQRTDVEQLCRQTLDFLVRACLSADREQLYTLFIRRDSKQVVKLLNTFSAGDMKSDIKECCRKIKTVLDN